VAEQHEGGNEEEATDDDAIWEHFERLLIENGDPQSTDDDEAI